MTRCAGLKALALCLATALCTAAGMTAWNRPEAGAQDQPVAAAAPWLKGTADEKFATIEKHLRGLDVAMAEIGYRYAELLWAVHKKNWEYAKYHTEKIDFALRLAVERRPKRAKSAEPFLKEAIPVVLSAIESKNGKEVDAAMARLSYNCKLCHATEKVLFFSDVVDRIQERAKREANP